MDFNQILELVRTVSASNLTSFQYEEGNQKILMQLGNGGMESNVSGLNVTPEVSSTEEYAPCMWSASLGLDTSRLCIAYVSDCYPLRSIK